MSVLAILAIVIGIILFIFTIADLAIEPMWWPWVASLFKKAFGVVKKKSEEVPKPKYKTLRIVEKKHGDGESYYIVQHNIWLPDSGCRDWWVVIREADGKGFYTARRGLGCYEWDTIEEALEVMEEYKEYLAAKKEKKANKTYSEVMVVE